MLYGFGELIDTSADIGYMLATIKNQSESEIEEKHDDESKLASAKNRLDIWKEKGMISAKEYKEQLELLTKNN